MKITDDEYLMSDKNLKNKATLVVLSSPSGAGKTTICQKILNRHKDYLHSISATTREKRKGEVNGRDYYFLSQEEFEQKIKKGDFVEWAWVFGHRYGTLKKFVTQAKKEGKVALFVPDVQGGMAIKKKYPDSILIFILPPSLKELKRRLIHRGTEGKTAMKRRLATALKEIKFWSKYDYVVINEDINQTVESTENIIKSEILKTIRFDYPGWQKKRG
jgi:guanylate kinase